MTCTRRRFLRTGVAASASLLVPGALAALVEWAAAGPELGASGYGPLVRDPERLLDLPAGFTYRALSTAKFGATDDPRFSQRLSNGELVPPRHDGMGAFRGPGGSTILVRNHELGPGEIPRVDEARNRPYDPLGAGGTTTLWVDSDRQLVRAFPSLSGTCRNCAGGVTPWGSWLSCEECTYMPGPADPTNHDRTATVTQRHGYVFEVDAHAEELVDPVPIRAMGRFYHEAAAVDPATGFVYQTEDRDDGLIYRFRPAAAGRGRASIGVGDLAKGGVLEALEIVGRPGAMTQNWGEARVFAPREEFRVAWVAIPDPDPDMDMERDPTDTRPDPLKRRPRTAATSTRAQGFARGAAQFARGEGMMYRKGVVTFSCTNGGKAHSGQVWRLDLRRQRLSLVVEPDDRTMLDWPDNLATSPNGDLIVCEDGEIKGENFVVGITPRGRLYQLARNAWNQSEFAGACSSADGRTMFLNLHEPGITFAIWGPWGKRKG